MTQQIPLTAENRGIQQSYYVIKLILGRHRGRKPNTERGGVTYLISFFEIFKTTERQKHGPTNLTASLNKVLGDAQHVCVLRQLPQVLLQLLFVPGDLA